MSPFRSVVVATAVGLSLLVAPAAGAAERTTPEGFPVPELDWRDCEDGFQCATAEVPRDYGRPRGATVRLALIKRPAADQANRIGSFFLNPGGPGGSGVDFVRTAPPGAFQLVSKFDWVGFDPRGVGASEPAVDCDELAEGFEPMTPDTFHLRTLLDRGRAIARLCQNRPAEFLASVNTGNTARDLDLLRAAVGDRRLTYLGISYGGMLGQTYASLFPGRARALVLDSPTDADTKLNRPLVADQEQLVGFEASLDRFFAACAATPETCRFGAGSPGAPEDAYDALLARLDETPIDLGDGRTIDDDDVRSLTVASLYSKYDWQALADGLAAVEAGDIEALKDFNEGDEGVDYDRLYDTLRTYNTLERRWPRRRVEPYLEHAENMFALAPHFGVGAYETVHYLFWPVRPRGAFHGPFRNPRNATPALVLHTTNDPATPYEWGKRVVRDLGNARMFTYRGDGHGVITDLNLCMLVPFVTYLEDQTLPPEGASCDQNAPFGTPAASESQRSEPRERWEIPVEPTPMTAR